MARRLSVHEEQEIVGYMRENPEVSERAVSRRFGRSRAIISRLKSRYALDKPQSSQEVQAAQPGPPGGESGVDPLEGTNLFSMTDEQFEILCARLEAKP
jgi:hypothetical protein